MKKHKNFTTNFIIDLAIYNQDIMVSIEESDESLRKRLLKLNIPEQDFSSMLNIPETTIGRTCILPGGQVIMRLKRLPKEHKHNANIAHEAFHAATFILERVGITLCMNTSDEAFAYLIAHIVEKIHEKSKL